MSTRPEVRPITPRNHMLCNGCAAVKATREVEFRTVLVCLCDPCADSLREQLRYLPNDASAGR